CSTVLVSGVGLAHDALFLAVPVTLFFGSAFVEQLLTLHQGDLAFYLVLFPVERERDAGIACLIHLADDLGDFLGVQQQFAGAGRVRNHMGRGGVQRRDVG